MNDQRTHIDLFSGIGGFALAANAAGYDTRVFCEQDDYCTGVLNRHWPGVPVIRDIREFDGSKWRGADLLTGGFPCQPFSQVGEQRGEEDDRHLWPEMFRIIKEARPRWVLGENVAGIIKMALDDVLSQLEGEGYTTGAVVLPACSLNAPHRRDRVWIIAHSKCKRWAEMVSGKTRIGATPGNGWPARNAYSCSSAAETLSAMERVYSEPAILGADDGIPKRVDRLKALGNAIVPQVAFEIIRLMTNGD